MNAFLRTLFAAAFVASAASAVQARSPQIIQGSAVSQDHVLALSLPMTSSLLASVMKTAAHVTTNGTTKALGASLDDRLGTSPALDHASHRLGSLIRTAICKGC